MDELTATCGCGATITFKGMNPNRVPELFGTWLQHEHIERDRPIDHWCPSESMPGGLRCQLAEGHTTPHSNYLGRPFPVHWTTPMVRALMSACARCDHNYDQHLNAGRCQGIASYTGDPNGSPCECKAYDAS